MPTTTTEAPAKALSWADLFVNGSLIDLDISLWDGLVRLIPEDIGIERTDAVRTAITFGHNRLVPKESLAEIRDAAGEARKAIDESTIPFKLVPGSRFMPKVRREKLKKQLEELRTKFQLAVNVFIDKYAQNRETHRPTMLEALTEAAKGNRAVAEQALRRLECLYPNEDVLRLKFAINWHIYSIAAPKDGSDDGGQGDMISRELGSMVDRLREQLTDKVKDIMELAGRGGKITQKTYNSALKVCERLDSLNVFCDQGLRQAVNAVRAAIEAAKGIEDPAATLTNGLSQVPAELAASRTAAINDAAAMMAGQAERRFGI